jgi:hypothetical protein
VASALWLTFAACAPSDPVAAEPLGPEPEVAPTVASLRRLTRPQFEASLEDVFGPGLILPPYLEPDVEVEGLVSVGAGQAALSPYGVEQYESAAYLVAQQVLADDARRAALPCEPAAEGCFDTLASTVGRRLWRRSLTAAELEVQVGLAETAADTLGDPDGGVEFLLASLLQSPNFLYRVEVGAGGAFSGTELASRMAYLAWGGPPDDELLDLAEAGELADPDVRRAQAERLNADPRAARGVRAQFVELLGLQGLSTLNKDPTTFVHAGPEVGPAAREETLSLVERLWAEDEDFRDLVTSRRTSVDRTLAAIYGIPAPAREGFGEVELPADGVRGGLFGQVSFLALQAHPVSTSVTRRGMFVRERLLCQDLPAPPANVDTSIPASTPDSPTMRDRVAVHLQDPVCASCHRLSDPMGLALEHFDGIGRYREDDQGYAIDTSGDLDGRAFDGLGGLALAVHDHPDFTRCLVTGALRYAQGHPLSEGEDELVDWFDARFARDGWSWSRLLEDVMASDGFVNAGEGE